MTFDEYQKLSRETAIYPRDDKNFNYPITYPALGLVSEAGEVAGKIKKIYRDNEGKFEDKHREEIKKELGDVLWYVAQLSSEMGLSMKDVALANLDKLRSRMERNQIKGSGDNR